MNQHGILASHAAQMIREGIPPDTIRAYLRHAATGYTCPENIVDRIMGAAVRSLTPIERYDYNVKA